MSTAIRILYRLSEKGCRNSLKAGGDGKHNQTAMVNYGDDNYNAAADLANLGYSQGPTICMDNLLRSDDGSLTELPIEYDDVPSIPQLILDETRRRETLARKAEEEKNARAAKRLAEAKKYAESPAEDLLVFCYSRYQVKDAVVEAAQDFVDEAPGLSERVAEAQAIACRKNTELADAEKREKNEKSTAALQRDKEKNAWIEAHGSLRLRRMVQEGIGCQAVYLDERLALDRPGWRWFDDVPGENKDPRNVPEEAFALLDEARKTAPEAKLGYWVVKHDHDESCFGDDCPSYDWTGYVALAKFLDDWIVFGGPESA